MRLTFFVGDDAGIHADFSEITPIVRTNPLGAEVVPLAPGQLPGR